MIKNIAKLMLVRDNIYMEVTMTKRNLRYKNTYTDHKGNFVDMDKLDHAAILQKDRKEQGKVEKFEPSPERKNELDKMSPESLEMAIAFGDVTADERDWILGLN